MTEETQLQKVKRQHKMLQAVADKCWQCKGTNLSVFSSLLSKPKKPKRGEHSHYPEEQIECMKCLTCGCKWQHTWFIFCQVCGWIAGDEQVKILD